MLPIIGIILVPGLLWVWVFYNAQRYKKVRLTLLVLLFTGGMASGLIALILNHAIEKYTLFWPGGHFPQVTISDYTIPFFSAGFWFLVGLNEEFAKLLILLLIAYPSRYIEETFDGILYAVVISVGFATMENFFYLNQYGIAVAITRTVITVPAHTFMSVPMGYFVAKSRKLFERRNKVKPHFYLPTQFIILGWLISAILHGMYDFLLSFNMETSAYLQILLMALISFWLSKVTLSESKNQRMYRGDM